MIYWCKKCNIPIIDRNKCSLCGSELKKISNDIRPVFVEEKKVISIILQRDITEASVWNKGSIHYIIDGENVDVNYVDLFSNDELIKIIREKYFKYTTNFDELINCNQFDYVMNDKYLSKFVIANEEHIKRLEYESQNYIKELVNSIEKKDIISTVSFSGGKDSTVVSNLVRETYGNQKIFHLFGDTTLEFDTTYNYIERFKEENKFTPFIISSSEQNFFNLCKEFGPPSRVERWCCTIFKTSAISENINLLGDSGFSLSFLGIRALESVQRSNYEKTRYSSKISRQIVSMPIYEWATIEVWLYILYKKLDFNAAYTLGFERVGCWCCPNNSSRSDFLMKLFFEKKYNYWHDILISYAKKANIKDYDVYVNEGYWKSRRGLRGLQKKNTNLNQKECNLNDKARIYFIEKPLDDSFIEFLKPFGSINRIFEDEEYSICEINYKSSNKGVMFKIYIYWESNTLKVIPVNIKDMILFYKRIECQIRKYEFCISCMACDSVCPYGAINTVNGYHIDETKCKSCLKCVAKFIGGCLRVQIHKSKI